MNLRIQVSTQRDLPALTPVVFVGALLPRHEPSPVWMQTELETENTRKGEAIGPPVRLRGRRDGSGRLDGAMTTANAPETGPPATFNRRGMDLSCEVP